MTYGDYIFNFQLAQILPTEENFLLLFRRENPLESSVEFMRVNMISFPKVTARDSNIESIFSNILQYYLFAISKLLEKSICNTECSNIITFAGLGLERI